MLKLVQIRYPTALLATSVSVVAKIVRTIEHRLGLIINDRQSRRFIKHNKRVWGGWKTKTDESLILADYHNISSTLISYSYFLNLLAKEHNARIKAFSGGRHRFPRAIYNRWLDNIYRSFNTSGFIEVSLSEMQKSHQRAISQEVIPTLQTKRDIFELTVSGVWIGIDIYETYLMRFRKPTVDLGDPRLIQLVKEGIGLVVYWQDFFAENTVDAVVVTHDCYLELDVLCKVAYANKVAVYLPNIRGIAFQDEPHSGYSIFRDYRKLFSNLSTDEQSSAISLAKAQLERRFGGEVAVDVSAITTKSAFQRSEGKVVVLRHSNKIKVLICSHCFYDNPHAFGGFLFVDFYEWLRYLGRISEKTDYDWYLKMHPDPLPGTEQVIRGILEDFPRIKLIPFGTSHHQLVEEGIDFVLTGYGTVGIEYPALGVQVINAGYNPRVEYDINWQPKTLEEYEYYLTNLDKLHKKIDMQELYECYYMSYYYGYADNLFLKSYFQFLRDLDLAEQDGAATYSYFLNQLSEDKHEEIVASIEDYLDSGKRYYFSHGPV